MASSHVVALHEMHMVLGPYLPVCFYLEEKPWQIWLLMNVLKANEKKLARRWMVKHCSPSAALNSAVSHGEGLTRVQELSLLRAGFMGAESHAFNSYATICSLEGWLACTALSF